jgi:urease accessory protein
VRVLDAPELASYQDEPKQMRSGAPGKNGMLKMEFSRQGSRSLLTHLYRRAPLLVQQGLYWDEHLPGLPCVFMISTSGCILQGDRLDISISVGVDAMAHITTQAATKIHEMDANFAAQSQELNLAENAYLELLPGPVIPHRRSRFVTHTSAAVAASATLLTAELVLPGRQHHGTGELFEYDLYSSALAVNRPDGSLLCSEKTLCEPWRYSFRRAGVMGEFDVLANVTLATPLPHAEAVLERVDTGLDAAAGCMAGASRLPGGAGLMYKVLGKDTEVVRTKVRQFWRLARQEVVGAPIPEPRSWE